MKSSRKQNIPTRCLAFASIVTFLLAASACGTKKPKDNTEGSDAIPAATDAGTDAVPQGNAEAPPPPTSSEKSSGSLEGGQPDTYTIKGGDTLMKIAFDIYGDVYKWKQIYEANKDKISDPNTIPKNVVLKIMRPGSPVNVDQNGDKYLIKKGDTLGKISGALYGTASKWKEIWENNKQLIHDPNKIFAGFFLHYTPSGGATTLGSAAPGADAGPATSGSPPAPSADAPVGHSPAGHTPPVAAEAPAPPVDAPPPPAAPPPADAPPAPASP